MKNHYRLALPLLLAAASPGLVLAAPLKIQGPDAASQMAIICPHCKQPITGVAAGDYNIALSADVLHPKTGVVNFQVSLTDKAGHPVTNAKVALTLSMPGHEHLRTVTATGGKGGRYTAQTIGVQMAGEWKAEVKVTPPKGEPVTETFTFTR